MPALSITKTYQDGDILTEADLDNIRESIEGFFNTTGIDNDNIQTGGVSASNIGIDDGEWLEFGTGNDGRIGVGSDDLLIQNVTTDQDIAISVSPSGVLTEAIRILGASGNTDVKSKKIINLANADLTTTGDAVNVAILKQFVPVGIVQAYGGTSAPTGWLLCDGSAVSRTTYADLFTLIGETAGQGDNATTFNVPDFRGRFLRGADNGAGVDPDAASRTAMNTGGSTGDAVFSIQDESVGPHSHAIQFGSGVLSQSGVDPYLETGTGVSDATDDSTGTETRPVNAAVNFIIKY